MVSLYLWTGESLLVADGPKWERNRRLLTPAFHFSILNGYFKVYNDVTDTLLVRNISYNFIMLNL